ncbi:unnamed protein product, partial [Meganyctiphanes norvegica]
IMQMFLGVSILLSVIVAGVSGVRCSSEYSGWWTPTRCLKYPLHWAASIGEVSQAKQLVEEGARINRRDGVGWSAVHEAIMWGRADMVKYLMRNGASVKGTGYNGLRAKAEAELYTCYYHSFTTICPLTPTDYPQVIKY